MKYILFTFNLLSLEVRNSIPNWNFKLLLINYKFFCSFFIFVHEKFSFVKDQLVKGANPKFCFDHFAGGVCVCVGGGGDNSASFSFSREATTPRLDLSDFSICILGYSQSRLISFDCIQNENVSLQFLIRWSKLNHIPHAKRSEIPVYKLTAVHFNSFSREATTPRLDLSDFSICILGYSQSRLISFDCIQDENVSLQFLIRNSASFSFSREATTPRLDLSGFFICILGYSQSQLISFDCIQNENVLLQFLIRWSKLNHIPHAKRFEIPVYKLTAGFIHFRRL